VVVEGTVKADSWETEGQKRSKLRVVCEKMQMLGGAGGASGGGGSRPRQAENDISSGYREGGDTTPGRGDAQPTGTGSGYDDPDIPF